MLDQMDAIVAGIRSGISFHTLSLRKSIASWLNPTSRNLEKECGVPLMGAWIPIQDFKNMYDRFGVAKRVVNIGPDGCWEVQPKVFEDSKKELTKFEKRLIEIGSSLVDPLKIYDDKEQRNPLFSKLLEADRKMGVGRFGAILIGIDDGRKLSEPVEGFGIEGISQRELTFIRSFDETQISVAAIETNEASVRYLKPTMYTIRPNESTDSTNALGKMETVSQQSSYEVHWHRIVHLSEGDVTHRPRQLSVWDHIIGLRKLYLGSPEMYWKGAFQGLSIEGEPGMGFGNPEQVRKDVADFQDGLKRALFWEGAKTKSLAPNVSDPTSQIRVQLSALCIDLDCPKRIFEGSERGELASTTDQTQWNQVITGRRDSVCIPKILVPVLSHLMMLGVLPRPNQYFIEWGSSDKIGATEAANILLTRTQSLATFIRGNGEQLIMPLDWFQEEWGYTKDKAEQILKNRTGLKAEDPEADLVPKQNVDPANANDPNKPNAGSPIDKPSGGSNLSATPKA